MMGAEGCLLMIDLLHREGAPLPFVDMVDQMIVLMVVDEAHLLGGK